MECLVTWISRILMPPTLLCAVIIPRRLKHSLDFGQVMKGLVRNLRTQERINEDDTDHRIV